MMNNTNKKSIEIDLQRIFLTPPNILREKITLIVMLVVTFIMFFAPLCFSDIGPAKSVILACMPAASLSWGWIVLLRSLFRKSDFCK